MKRWNKILISLTFLHSLSACSAPNKEQTGITEVDYNNPKTVCIGRLEVTVPKETEVTYSSFNFNGSDFKIDNSIKTYEDYQKIIQEKINYLKKEPHEIEGVLFKNEMPGPVGNAGRSMSHIIAFREHKFAESLYQVYGYLYLGPGQLLVLKSGASNHLLNEAIVDMQHTLKSVSKRKPKETRAGICWSGLLILDDMSEYRYFDTSVVFQFPSYPGMRSYIINRGRYDSEKPLISVVKHNKANLPLEVKTLTKDTEIYIGNKEINGLLGEEYSINTALRKPFQRGFELMDWEYLGELENPHHPYIKFHLSSENEMDNEGYGDSLVNQNRVVHLWDFILGSIKISSNNEVEQDGNK